MRSETRSGLRFGIPLCLTLLLGVAATSQGVHQDGHKSVPQDATVRRKSVQQPAQAAFDQTVWPYFTRHCASCHNAQTRAGALDIQTLHRADSLTAPKTRETWESVIRKIQNGEMPPKGSPRPAEAESKTILQRIEQEWERVDRAAPANPGSVTAHRLNRAEYNNTVRDLLGVSFRPADDFPQDDSGYGFDNIGDVLSLSPSQMEKYVSAAEKIARTALFGPEKLAPTLVRHEVPGRHLVPTTEIPATYDVTGLGLPNSVHAMHRFPVDGEYLFRFDLNGVRPLGSDPLHLGLWIDGKRVQALDIDTQGSAAFNLDRQDFSGRTRDCRLRVTAGEHWIAATIERMYEGLPSECGGPNPSTRHVPLPEFKPPPNATPERIEEIRKRFEARRKEKVPVNDARVSALEIGGPYAQTDGPSEESLRKIFTCGHLHGGHQTDCTRKIVGGLASRAFRRPATPHEIDRFTSLVALAQKQGDSYEEGICLAIQGILVSPHFLYRIERDPLPISPAISPASATIKSTNGTTSSAALSASHRISPYELASRLSYFLWSSMPDDELRACAERQTLRQPEVLNAQVRRMLLDPRSHALSENFGGQWLQIRSLESSRPDRERFPDFDDYLRMSMRQETERFFDSIVQENGSILDFLDGKYTFLNGRLATFYGIPGVEGPDFRRVNLTGTRRAGVLTQASVLTVTSYPNRTSPVLRGKWILENLLDAPPPAPPPGVPNLDVSTVGKDASLRQQLEAHRKNPTCAACHSRMDPLGFGLENFNAVGAWRERDGKIPIDASGTLPNGRSFQGSEGLRTVLKADKEAFARCITTKLLTYALGRGLERYDRPIVTAITSQLAAHDYRFATLVTEIVNSKPFQMRENRH